MDIYFSFEAMIRGYHIYKDIWDSEIGERLSCQVERNNRHDTHAVAVIKSNNVVGHLPQKISLICSLFLGRSGTSIECEVIANRRYSHDLLQGGLEIPCIVYFRGSSPKCKDTAKKAEKLVRIALGSEMQIGTSASQAATITVPDKASTSVEKSSFWVKRGCIVLSFAEKDEIRMDKELSDLHINFAQVLLKQQCGLEKGFYSTLLQGQQDHIHPKIQIVHSRGNHWIVASTVLSEDSVVNIYDTLYDSLDTSTIGILNCLFEKGSKYHVANISKQKGGKDCGVYAIAISTLLVNKLDPEMFTFVQEEMREHLIECFETGQMTPFPVLK